MVVDLNWTAYQYMLGLIWTWSQIFVKRCHISALWDFVRIIDQKQNRLKFIITLVHQVEKLCTLQISRRAAFCSLDTSCLYLWQNVSKAWQKEIKKYLRSSKIFLPGARGQEVGVFRFWSQGSETLQRQPLDKARHTSCPRLFCRGEYD